MTHIPPDIYFINLIKYFGSNSPTLMCTTTTRILVSVQ